jgi:hypothetical protein
MLVLVPVRSLLLLAAGGLAACAGTPDLARSVTLTPGERTTLLLQSYRGPLLSLHNETSGSAADVYSASDDPLRKVVPDVEMQALLDVFTEEQLFPLSLPQAPGGARDVLVLDQDGRRWIWARRGLPADPRDAAFQKVQSYFLALYNGNTAYHSAIDADSPPSFENEAAKKAREAREAKAKLEGLEGGRDQTPPKRL